MWKTLTRCLLLCLLVAFAALRGFGQDEGAAVAPDQDLAAVPTGLRQALLAGETELALASLRTLRTSQPEDADLWDLLEVTARTEAGQLEEALALTEAFDDRHPDSAWGAKVRFRRAELLRRLGRFRESELLWEQAAQELRAPERQGELAAVYLEHARRLSTPPEVARPSDGELDFARAHGLYAKVLELDAPEAAVEEALWNLPRCREALEQWGQAAADWQRYLDREGAERPLEARFRRGDALRRASQFQDARRVFEDLLQDLPEDEDAGGLAARTRFALARVWTSLDGAIARTAYDRFLVAHPDHPLSPRALFARGQLLYEAQDLDGALDVFANFPFWPTPEDLTTEQLEELERLRQEALYLEARVLFALGRHGESAERFADYTRRFPSGARWAEAQQGIVDNAWAEGARLREEEAWDRARDAFEAFLVDWPLDPRVQQVQLDLAQLDVSQARALEEEDGDPEPLFRSAVERLRGVARRYPGSETASQALYTIGVLLELELGDLPGAVETYRSCTFGSRAPVCQARLRAMVEPSLDLRTPGTARSTEDAAVDVRVRNHETFEVRVYSLDLLAYFKKHLTHRRIEDLDLDLIAPDRTFEVEVEGYEEFAPLEQTVALPVDGPGVWAVTVRAGELQSTTLVVRSDVDVLVKSSRREVFVYAQDMPRGAPADGVSVLVALPGQGEGGGPLLRELVTDGQGVARLPLDELEHAGQVRVLAHRDGHVASDGLSLDGLGRTTGLTPRGHVSSERALYRPGERVLWRAILREVEQGAYAFTAGEDVAAEVRDPQGQVLHRWTLPLSEFGTVHGTLDLPGEARTGTYTLTCEMASGQRFDGAFEVREFQLARVELSLEADPEVVYRGEEVTVTARAAWYYGEPLAGARLAYHLPDGRQLETRTDAEGRATFTFPTRDFGFEGRLGFYARLVEENVAAQGDVYLAQRGFRIQIDEPRRTVLAGESVALGVRALSPGGERLARPLTLSVLRREQRHGRWHDVPVEELEVTTTEEGPDTRAFAFERGGTHLLRAVATDRFGNPVEFTRELFVSGEDDPVRLRLLTERSDVEVGREATLQVVNRAGAGPALVTFEGETVLGHRLVDLSEGASPLTFPVGAEHFPNVAVVVSALRDGAFHEARADLEVTRGLRVTLRPEREVYGPGEEAVVRVEVTDQLGRPVRAELGLAVVDDALWQLAPGDTRPLTEVFHAGARRSAGLRSATSCTFSYQGRTVHVDGALLAEQARQEAAQQWDEQQVFLRDSLERLSELGYAGEGLDVALVTQNGYRGPGDAAPAMGGGGGAGGPATPGPAAPGAPSAGRRLRAGLMAPEGSAQGSDRSLGETRGQTAVTGSDDFFLGHGQAQGARDARGRLESTFGLELRNASKDVGRDEPLPDGDTLFWSPSVVTDADGRAEVRFELPDRATRWRLAARGVDRGALFGDGEATLVSRSDFFLDLTLPTSLTEGDVLRPTVRVHDRTGRGGPAVVSLTLVTPEGARTLTRNVTLDGTPVQDVAFGPLPATPLVDEVRFVAEARATEDAEDGADDDADAVAPRRASAARTLDVRPYGLAFADGAGGVLRAPTTVFLELPAGRSYGPRELELFVGNGLRESLVDEALGRGPFAPHRRALLDAAPRTRANELLGVCAVRRSLERSGAGRDEQLALLRERAQGLLASLVTAQNPDGGWGWMPGTGSVPEVSARCGWALAAAREVGLDPPARTREQVVRYLEQAFQGASQQAEETKAELQHALATLGHGDFAAVNRLVRQRLQLSPAALCSTALALAAMDRAPMAQDLAQQLESMARVESPGPGRPARCAWPVDGNSTAHRDRTEQLALALEALLAVVPASERVDQARAALLDHRPWGTARGLVLHALVADDSAAAAAAGDARVTVTVEGLDPQVVELEAEGAGRRLTFDLAGVRAREVRLDLVPEGTAPLHFTARLEGFSRDLDVRTSWERGLAISEHVRHTSPPRLDGRELPTGFGSVTGFEEPWENTVSNLPLGDVTHVRLRWWRDSRKVQDGHLLLDVPLPAGARLVEDSLRGAFGEALVERGSLVVPIDPRQTSGHLDYSLVGVVPGEYRVLPATLRSLNDPASLGLAEAEDLTVLERGVPSPDEYRPTPDELLARGQRLYEAGDDEGAHAALARLFEDFEPHLRERPLVDAAHALLMLSIRRGEPDRIVEYFEVLKEKDPSITIPFDEVVAIGEAYRSLSEYERALLIFRATVLETFGKDVKVVGALEQLGEFAGAMTTLQDLWLAYPDAPVVTAAHLTLADKLALKASAAHRDESVRRAGWNRATLVLAAVRHLDRFLALHPTDPQAADAALALVSARVSVEDHEAAAELAGEFAARFTRPRYADAFLYSRAVSQWQLGQEQAALEALQRIADAEYTGENGRPVQSENRDLALYILGQIHHARRELGQAAEYYEQVEQLFSDAHDALVGFRKKLIALEEVTEVAPGEEVRVTLTHKGLTEAELLVYEVDLLTLYLREKNLTGITSVNLSGIAPTLSVRVPLEDGPDLREQETEAALALDTAGAYLVMARGEGLFASGLVLVTDLELEVVEDPTAGRVRVQALDRGDGHYVRDVDVRVVGSQGGTPTRGETDPRGLFVADGVAGAPTVIARLGDDHYAFHRSPVLLAQAEAAQFRYDSGGLPVQQDKQQLYFQNVIDFNDAQNGVRLKNWNDEVSRSRKGVQVQQVK